MPEYVSSDGRESIIFQRGLWRERERERERGRVNRCFEPSQPLGITSGLKETSTKRYIVERTNKAEIRREEQSEKRRVVRRINGMKYS